MPLNDPCWSGYCNLQTDVAAAFVASSNAAQRRVEHFIKDMGIALAEAEKMNLCLPGLGLAK